MRARWMEITQCIIVTLAQGSGLPLNISSCSGVTSKKKQITLTSSQQLRLRPYTVKRTIFVPAIRTLRKSNFAKSKPGYQLTARYSSTRFVRLEEPTLFT